MGGLIKCWAASFTRKGLQTWALSARTALLPLLLGIVYGLVVYRGDGLTIGGDYVIPLHAIQYLHLFFQVHTGSSLPAEFSLPPLPDTIIFALFNIFGISIYLANKLYFLILSIVSSLSIWYLARSVFKNERNKDIIGIVAAISYLFNPWVYSDTFKSLVFIELSLVQSGFILFLAFLIRFFQSGSKKYAIYGVFSSALMLSNPGVSGYDFALLATAAYLLLFIYRVIFPRKGIRLEILSAFKGAMILGLGSLILNSYWVIPFLTHSTAFATFATNFQPTSIFNQYSNIANTIRLMNSWAFNAGFAPYAMVFQNNGLIEALTFMWPILLFSPLIFHQYRSRKVLYGYLLTTLAIIMVWLSAALPNTYLGLTNVQILGYYFLRPFYNTAVLSESILTVSYCVFIGLATSIVHSYLTKKTHFRRFRVKILVPMLSCIIVGLLIVSSWPIPTGDVMRNWYYPSQYGTQIPASYWSAAKYTESLSGPNVNVLLLPPVSTYIATTWNFQGSSQFYNLMFTVPLITGNQIPYGISSNDSALQRIFGMYYSAPKLASGVDIESNVSAIGAYGTHVSITYGQVIINFTKVTPNTWDEAELRFQQVLDWSNQTYLIVRATNVGYLNRVQFGVGDSQGYVGWWSASNNEYVNESQDFVPLDTSSSKGSVTSVFLLFPLDQLSLSHFSISNVTSIWIRYLSDNSSVSQPLKLEWITTDNLALSAAYYASIWRNYQIEYLIMDKSIVLGIEGSLSQWESLVNGSNLFQMLWHEDSLYIYRISP